MSAARSPLAARNGEVSSASVVKFAAGTADKPAPRAAPARGLNVVPSFSVLSSGLPSTIIAEELILKGAKKKPVGGQTMETFYKSITHLHFANQRLLDDVAAITLCSNLRVLYVYENRLTTLRGLGGLQRLTHLYAQDNHIESLDDFEAPPNLEQLHLTGNRLRLIGGLETCTALQELHVGGQKLLAPPAASRSEEELEPLEEPADAEAYEAAKAAAKAPASAADAAALSFEPASLMAIAPTLVKLVASNSRVDDDALEPLVVLQGLTSLDLRGNRLASIGRLQQFLLRMPRLGSLQLCDNPLCEAPKMRERLIVAAAALAEVDGRPVKPNERAFLESLAAKQTSAGGDGSRSGSGGSGGGGGGGGVMVGSSRQSSAHRNRGREQQLGVSIPSAQSYDLGPRAGLLLGEPPAGFYEEQHMPVSLTLGNGSRRPWARSPAFN